MKGLIKLGTIAVATAMLTACSCGCSKIPVDKLKQAPAKITPVAQCEFTLNGDVLFDFDKYNLSAQGKAELADVAQKLKNCSSNVTVTGYTDRLGSVAYNINLSQNRANTVANYLRTQGVNNITPVGKGKEDQIKACEGFAKTAAGKHSQAEKDCLRPNRRVVIFAL